MEYNKSDSMASIYSRIEKMESSPKDHQRGFNMVANRPPPAYVKPQGRLHEEDDSKKVRIIKNREVEDDLKKVRIIKSREVDHSSTVDVNQSAEAFINRFRHQLKIERLDSIENFNQRLERGR